MADMEYKISFNRGDFQRDIAERLKRDFEWATEGPTCHRHPFLEFYQRAGKAIDELLKQGNHAIYQGLIELGVQEAKRIQK